MLCETWCLLKIGKAASLLGSRWRTYLWQFLREWKTYLFFCFSKFLHLHALGFHSLHLLYKLPVLFGHLCWWCFKLLDLLHLFFNPLGLWPSFFLKGLNLCLFSLCLLSRGIKLLSLRWELGFQAGESCLQVRLCMRVCREQNKIMHLVLQ